MKSICLLIGLALGLSASLAYEPQRISYSDLHERAGDQEHGGSSSDADNICDLATTPLFDALLADGIVSVTDVPGYSEARRATLSWDALHSCIEKTDEAAAAAAAETESNSRAILQTNRFPDGTVRRILSSYSVIDEGGARSIEGLSSSSSCDKFVGASDPLRASVAAATKAFVAVLGPSLGLNGTSGTDGPILVTEDGHPFETFDGIVDGARQMEHFVTYQHNQGLAEGEAKIETIGMHTDQGLFTVFAPGQLVGEKRDFATDDDSPAGGFYVGLSNGTIVEMEFDKGDLVFMLGDAFDQYVQPKIVPTTVRGGAASCKLLRATPHAFVMPPHYKNEARTWYGRMVMLPFDALLREHGMRYGKMKESGKLAIKRPEYNCILKR